jgi:hypothetical protein
MIEIPWYLPWACVLCGAIAGGLTWALAWRCGNECCGYLNVPGTSFCGDCGRVRAGQGGRDANNPAPRPADDSGVGEC